MTPRLAAIAGPLKDTVYELTADEFSIGRESANQLSLTEASVSRRHCVITREPDGRYKLRDLDSSNGTSVNGLPIRERFLEHGAQIAIGGSRFVFLSQEGEWNASQDLRETVMFDERQLVVGSTLRLRPEDAAYLRPESAEQSLPPLALMARDLTVLSKIGTKINSIRETEALERQLLEFILEVVPAERGAILLVGESPEEIVPAYGLDRVAGDARPVEVSRTIARQVLGEGVAILSNDVSERAEFAEASSLIAKRISSLLCVPLVLFGRVLGAIYLTTTDPAARFNEGHLQLLAVISGIAAVALENARHIERLAGDNQRLRDSTRLEHNMVGESTRMREVYALIARLAPTDATVLIRGESGTGKELAAHAIHHNSPRAERPFIAINCATLTETLLESELFGHERGAFTGAIAQKRGKLEAADGGTLFLDELGEMSPLMQAKLLRVLQERQFERVGGTKTIRVDVRVIAATNRDLERAISEGGFRQDLYFRLNVVSFEMPPLRERREDIALLASFFATRYGQKCKRRVSGISPAARSSLSAYDWPGNVRELENAIERAVVLGSTELILPEDLPEMIVETEQDAATAVVSGAASTVQTTGGLAAPGGIARYHEAVREAKKELILRAVERTGGNYTEAARLLGVHANYLHRLVRNLNLRASLKKSDE